MTPGPGIFRTKLPIGFLAGGVNCGVRRYRPDLGLVVSEVPAVAAGVFTQNSAKAAPVKYCESLLPAENICAVITNSGQANAATGADGPKDNLAMATAVAENLNCKPEQVLTASTGVIGEKMAIEKIVSSVPTLCNSVTDIAEKFATAILTTDLVPKSVYKTVKLKAGDITITGIAKGSGMIHPNMATMLGYLMTDVALSCEQAQQLLSNATDVSFNMISVDGETSTNDCVFLLANGASKVAPQDKQDLQLLQLALTEIATELAKSIARDGEGATRLLTVTVAGALTETMAKQVARSLTVSPLLKSAIYGEQPNWGRVIARIGMEAVPVDQCKIFFQHVCVFDSGTTLELPNMTDLMKQDVIQIIVDIAAGEHSATAWGCDMSEKYVKINAEYLS